MTPELIKTIVQLRAAVGLLGEQGPKAWWPSAFFSASSRSFLSPLFPRTLPLSQLQGVTAAAARVHDERIGVGSVFHLFRLPEDIEQAAHRLLEQGELARQLSTSVTDRESALDSLNALAASQQPPGGGPIRVGRVDQLSNPGSWRLVAAHYAAAFQVSLEVFPFFSAT